MKEFDMRLEQPGDYRENENVTREAFWDVYRPGCYEHLVLHKLRESKNIVPELDYVVLDGEKIVGNIVYSKVEVTSLDGTKQTAIGFGPISVLPEYQSQGIGKELILVTTKKAKELGYPAVFITGNHKYYHRFGFESASRYGVYLDGMDQSEEAAFFMVLVLDSHKMDKIKGICEWDAAFMPSDEELSEFEKGFPYKEKREPRDTDL